MAKESGMVGHPGLKPVARRGKQARTPPPPLDQSSLERLAFRYVERYATTRGKLVDYLRRKLRERGWEADRPADPEAIADAHVAAGHVDDVGYAKAKTESLARRGFGERRIDATLRAHRIRDHDRQAALEELPDDGTVAALRLLKRRRLGPFARGTWTEVEERRALNALLRAGHDFADARAALACSAAEADRRIEEASTALSAGPWG